MKIIQVIIEATDPIGVNTMVGNQRGSQHRGRGQQNNYRGQYQGNCGQFNTSGGSYNNNYYGNY